MFRSGLPVIFNLKAGKYNIAHPVLSYWKRNTCQRVKMVARQPSEPGFKTGLKKKRYPLPESKEVIMRYTDKVSIDILCQVHIIIREKE